MDRFWWRALILAVSLTALAQNRTDDERGSGRVMVVAVSRNDSVLTGGISSGGTFANGKVGVEPLAWLTATGDWEGFSCDEKHPEKCAKFEKEYLKKPHAYTVVSADGRGATVQVKQMSLDNECFGYGGYGTLSERSTVYAAVAASSTEIFSEGASARRLGDKEAKSIGLALASAVGHKLASTKELRVYSMQLEGQNLFAVQRAFQDYASKPEYKAGTGEALDSIFAIGTMKGGHFHVLHWKEIRDDNEQILGMIHLKNGRDFLVNTVSDPETQFFRIYGIRKGKLTMVYSGGGGGC